MKLYKALRKIQKTCRGNSTCLYCPLMTFNDKDEVSCILKEDTPSSSHFADKILRLHLENE